jgi:ATPase family associated with various cellular activities (AAA)
MSSSAAGVATPSVAAQPAPFRTAGEHLLAELQGLKLLLHRQVLRLRAATLLREDQFRGLYISDEEVDAILARRAAADPQGSPAVQPSPSLEALSQILGAVHVEIARRLEATESAGIRLPFLQLAERLSLSPFERFVLLVCVAPELDARFDTLYAYVQNDVTKKHPTPNLILNLYCDSDLDALALRPAFSASSPLWRVPLLRVGSDGQDRDPSLLTCPLRADGRVVDHLLDQDSLDDRLRSFTDANLPSRSLQSLRFPEALRVSFANIATAFGEQGGMVLLAGTRGSGRHAVAEAISARQERPLVTARLERMVGEALAPTQAFQLLQREALLRGANLYLGAFDSLFPGDASGPEKRAALLRQLSPNGILVFASTTAPLSIADIPARVPALSFYIPAPEFYERVALWSDALATLPCARGSVDSSLLANKFLLTGGEIESICREALSRARLRDPAAVQVFLGDIEGAAREQSNQGLRRLAQKVTSIHAWDDLVLPARCVRQLREVCSSEKFRHVIYTRWGYDRHLAQGRGLNTLFCGPSGTGKTMAAGIIAKELALDLYKIDLSSVVSKYIGETEKQLNQIFREAASSNAILFFDEADALFGKRSEVKDAHDRYANVEVAYLLQKMEEYEGIVILATNFRRNMDDAFTRRMHHIVEFPFPDAELRERIWKGLIPAAAPLAADVNLAFLARHFELAGGNIRNIALAAAFLAAESGAEIAMEHFIRATARELHKLGKMPARAEFREYYDLLRMSI